MARYRARKNRARLPWEHAPRKGKYKSRLELLFAAYCLKNEVPFEYEADKFPYIRPSHYTPDWKISEGVYIETKGYLAPSDRAKLLAFAEQYPQIRILLLFGNSDNRLNARSKTTYGQWATKSGFEWADMRDGLPIHWWKKYRKEIDNSKSLKRPRRQSRSNPSNQS